MIVIFLHNEENDYQTHVSGSARLHSNLLHIYRFSLMYLFIFLIPDRASRSRNMRQSSRRRVADDADEVDTREQGAWRLPDLRGLETDKMEGWQGSIGNKGQ
jgi:hypothetical protein